NSDTSASPSARRARMARRVGSASAAKATLRRSEGVFIAIRLYSYVAIYKSSRCARPASPACMIAGESARATPVERASSELRYEEYLADSHRPAFDGMRGIGFLMVITAHIPSVPLFGYLQGWTAVWLFFAISGYLVTMLMMREEKGHGRVAFGPFLVKRFFRIVPAYWM